MANDNKSVFVRENSKVSLGPHTSKMPNYKQKHELLGSHGPAVLFSSVAFIYRI